MFGNVEQSKTLYTDKYVMLSDPQPRLKRFAGLVGQVKTVNMSGRALVEWLDYHDNIGWYDIEIGQLKVVEKPAEPVAKPTAKAAPVTKKPSGVSPLELLRKQGAAKGAAAPTQAKEKQQGLSPLEQLRKQVPRRSTETTAPPAASDKVKVSGLSPIEILRQQAAEKKQPKEYTAPNQQASAGKPSTADILAQLRNKHGDSQ